MLLADEQKLLEKCVSFLPSISKYISSINFHEFSGFLPPNAVPILQGGNFKSRLIKSCSQKNQNADEDSSLSLMHDNKFIKVVLSFLWKKVDCILLRMQSLCP